MYLFFIFFLPERFQWSRIIGQHQPNIAPLFSPSPLCISLSVSPGLLAWLMWRQHCMLKVWKPYFTFATHRNKKEKAQTKELCWQIRLLFPLLLNNGRMKGKKAGKQRSSFAVKLWATICDTHAETGRRCEELSAVIHMFVPPACLCHRSRC